MVRDALIVRGQVWSGISCAKSHQSGAGLPITTICSVFVSRFALFRFGFTVDVHGWRQQRSESAFGQINAVVSLVKGGVRARNLSWVAVALARLDNHSCWRRYHPFSLNRG